MIGTPQERFWAKVEKSNSCWLWRANCNPEGYGQFWLNGKLEKAHRISWTFKHGAIPDRLLVLHKCDNPPCVNPEHLFLGTDRDNSRDRIRKGLWTPNQHVHQTHCLRGHEFTEANTCRQRRNGRVQRICRTCRRQRNKGEGT